MIEKIPQIKTCFGIIDENAEDIITYYVSLINKKIKKTRLIPVSDIFPYENSMGNTFLLCKNGVIVAAVRGIDLSEVR